MPTLASFSDTKPDQLAYRIVEMKHGLPHTLFHGLPAGTRRSRRLPTDTWLPAEVKPVSYGRNSPFMDSGFNVLLEKPELEAYLKRFTADRELRLAYCYVRDLRPKPNATSNVMLADWLYLPSDQFN